MLCIWILVKFIYFHKTRLFAYTFVVRFVKTNYGQGVRDTVLILLKPTSSQNSHACLLYMKYGQVTEIRLRHMHISRENLARIVMVGNINTKLLESHIVCIFDGYVFPKLYLKVASWTGSLYRVHNFDVYKNCCLEKRYDHFYVNSLSITFTMLLFLWFPIISICPRCPF